MKHKPNCSINMRCTVYHTNGICNHPKYGKCDCEAMNQPPQKETNKGIESRHEVPEGHKYCQKCGKEYGVDYFEGDMCGVSSNNPFSLSEREVPGYKIVGASTTSPLNMEESQEKARVLFNGFIEKWCSENYAHFINTDENEKE